MFPRLAATTAFFFCLAGAPQAAEWLCIGDQSVGFEHKDKGWGSATLEPTHFIVSSEREGSGAEHLTIFEFGVSIPLAQCRAGERDRISCESNVLHFAMSTDTRRFIVSRFGGMLLAENVPFHRSSPSIEFGTCSAY